MAHVVKSETPQSRLSQKKTSSSPIISERGECGEGAAPHLLCRPKHTHKLKTVNNGLLLNNSPNCCCTIFSEVQRLMITPINSAFLRVDVQASDSIQYLVYLFINCHCQKRLFLFSKYKTTLALGGHT